MAFPWPGLNPEAAGELGPSLGHGPPHCTWPQVWPSFSPGSLHRPSSAQNRQTPLLVSVITSSRQCCMVTLPQRKAHLGEGGRSREGPIRDRPEEEGASLTDDGKESFFTCPPSAHEQARSTYYAPPVLDAGA